jgi:hypothetical protein
MEFLAWCKGYISDFLRLTLTKKVGLGWFNGGMRDMCTYRSLLSCINNYWECNSSFSFDLLSAGLAFVSAPPELLQVGRSSIRADSGVGFCFLGPAWKIRLYELVRGFFRYS